MLDVQQRKKIALNVHLCIEKVAKCKKVVYFDCSCQQSKRSKNSSSIWQMSIFWKL
jgi:hypothetical protein